MPVTIWLMTILSFWTFFQRLFHTWYNLREVARGSSTTGN
jgi:hypothetical protein